MDNREPKKSVVSNMDAKDNKILTQVYLKTDGNFDDALKRKINLKKNILKNDNRQNKNQVKFDELNKSASINLNPKKIKKIKDETHRKILSNTFIEKKRKDNNNNNQKLNSTYIERRKKEIPKIEVENYNSTVISKRSKDPENAKNNKGYVNTYSTNYDNSRRSNKKEEIEAKNSKILNTEENRIIKKKIDNKSNKRGERNNKSIEKRSKARYSPIDKKKVLKLDNYNTINNEKIPSTEKIKNKTKMKIDKNNVYKGIIDTKNLIISDSIDYIHEKINNGLNENKIKFSKVNDFKYSCCSKNMDKFFIEIYFVSKLKEYSDTIKKDENSNDDENYENALDSNEKCLFYIKLLLSKDANDIPNTKLLEKVMNSILNYSK